jgi:ABC-type multidrug transport system fused ATPase/permease subunit
MSLRRALSLSALQKLLGPRVATWLCISFGFSLVLSAVELGIAGFLQLFLSSLGILSDSVQLAGAFGIRKLSPGTLAIGLLAIGAVRAVAQYLLAYSASVTQENITLRLRRIAIWEMLLHPSRAFVSASSVTTRLSEHFVKASYFAYAGTNFLAMAVQVVVLALLLLFSAPFETLVAFSGLLVLGIVVLRLNRAAGRKAARVPEQLEIVTRGIQLVARNFFLVRAVRTERAEHQRLSQAVDRYAEEGIGAGSLSSVAAALTPFVGTVLIVAIVVFSQHVMHTPGIRLLSFLYLFLRFVQTLGTAVVHMTNCNQTAPQFARSLSYVDGFSREQVAQAMAPESVPGNDAAADDADAAAVVPPAIRAAGLSFRYSDDDRPVLDNVSFEVRAGSQFAVVGPSGSGKSTLLALVLGLSEPTSGTITVDGQAPVRYFERPEARVGYVGADPFLLAGTLSENLVTGPSQMPSSRTPWPRCPRASTIPFARTVRAFRPGKSSASAWPGRCSCGRRCLCSMRFRRTWMRRPRRSLPRPCARFSGASPSCWSPTGRASWCMRTHATTSVLSPGIRTKRRCCLRRPPERRPFGVLSHPKGHLCRVVQRQRPIEGVVAGHPR